MLRSPRPPIAFRRSVYCPRNKWEQVQTVPMESDIAVMGGGPAGGILAASLCKLGFSVSLISRPRRFHAIEGLSERALKGLEFAGFDQTIASVGPRVQRVAMWNGERHEANHEWIVDRRGFDAGLLDDAARQGVRLLNGTVRGFEGRARGWNVTWTTAGRAERRLEAAYLVDARGRASRRAAADWVMGPPTFALARRCRSSPTMPPRTAVLTLPNGWLWLADDGESEAVAQLFVSTSVSPLPARPEIDSYFERQLATVDADGLLEVERVGRVVVRDAATAMRHRPIGDGFACVGDAALAIDPLAGHGIYEAISGALALAPVINTILRDPQRSALAERFYQEKLRTDFWRLARTGREFYRTETRWSQGDFWRERRAWPDDEPAHKAPLSSAPVVERRPVSEDGFIRERPVVVTPDHPRGIWQVAGVPLAELQKLAQGQRDQRGFSVQSAADHFKVPPAGVAAALTWLRQRGLLPRD